MRDLIEFADVTNKLVYEAYKHPTTEDVDLILDGPNIVFKSGSVQFLLHGYRFKPNSRHTTYENVLGKCGAIVSFSNRASSDEELKKEVTRKVKLLTDFVFKEFSEERYIPELGEFPII